MQNNHLSEKHTQSLAIKIKQDGIVRMPDNQ